MSDTSILPRHSTLVEQALEDALRSRADVGDLPNLWNPNTCPARFLPWLAWALSVDDWDDAWPESRKRAVIAASVDVHRRKGTPAGVRAALKAMGYGWAEIVEAKDFPRLGGLPATSARYPLGRLWRLGDPGMLLGGRPTAGTTRARPLGWGWRLGKPGHWADYMVLLDRVITKDDADALAGRLGKVAPARCRLAQIRLAGVRHALGDGLWQLGRTIPLGGAFGAEGVFTGPEIWVSGLWVPERLFREAESGVLLAFAPDGLFADAGLTAPVAAPGDPVGGVVDLSGNGNHATQDILAARPIYGIVPETGRRNMLTYSADLTINPPWSRNGAVVTTPSTAVFSAALQALFQGFNTETNPQGMTATFSVTLSGTGEIYIGVARKGSGPYEETKIKVSLGLTPVRYSVSHTMADAAQTGFLCFLGSGADISSAEVVVAEPQLELGSTSTAYQRVGSQYDVTEAGVRSLPYLYRDGVDDELAAVLPDLGTDATVAWASDQGVTIQTGQTIGAGAFDVLRDEKLFGLVAIDRPLDGLEAEQLAAWLARRAPINKEE